MHFICDSRSWLWLEAFAQLLQNKPWRNWLQWASAQFLSSPVILSSVLYRSVYLFSCTGRGEHQLKKFHLTKRKPLSWRMKIIIFNKNKEVKSSYLGAEGKFYQNLLSLFHFIISVFPWCFYPKYCLKSYLCAEENSYYVTFSSHGHLFSRS